MSSTSTDLGNRDVRSGGTLLATSQGGTLLNRGEATGRRQAGPGGTREEDEEEEEEEGEGEEEEEEEERGAEKRRGGEEEMMETGAGKVCGELRGWRVWRNVWGRVWRRGRERCRW